MTASVRLPETEREVRHTVIAAGTARCVFIRRRYTADVEAVWAACTEPDRLSRWFLGVSGDLREGGTFQLRDNAHGTILCCQPPRLLRLTWQYGDRAVDEVELRLASENGGTVLELEHATATRLVEWEGEMVDVLPDMGPGWETPLALTLPRYMRGELPEGAGLSGPDDAAVAALIREEWAAVVERWEAS
jgi:uncharacterized protein YndB with AHSA1/START domain